MAIKFCLAEKKSLRSSTTKVGPLLTNGSTTGQGHGSTARASTDGTNGSTLSNLKGTTTIVTRETQVFSETTA